MSGKNQHVVPYGDNQWAVRGAGNQRVTSVHDTQSQAIDLKTPLGSFPLMECWYRADRLDAPQTSLPLRIIQKDDGWCDDVKSPFYNQHVKLPFEPSHEELWREDEKYDIIVTLGYNIKPLVPGKGSAIFFHVAPEGYPPTQGCVGLLKRDLLEVLKSCSTETLMRVKADLPEAVGY